MTPADRRHAIEKLKAEPCTCEHCKACDGTGTVRYANSIDGFDTDYESCDYCTNGVSRVCDRCQLLEELTDER